MHCRNCEQENSTNSDNVFFFFFVKRGVVIEILIDSNSGELQLNPLLQHFLIFTIGFKCSYDADFDFVFSVNRFKKYLL